MRRNAKRPVDLCCRSPYCQATGDVSCELSTDLSVFAHFSHAPLAAHAITSRLFKCLDYRDHSTVAHSVIGNTTVQHDLNFESETTRCETNCPRVHKMTTEATALVRKITQQHHRVEYRSATVNIGPLSTGLLYCMLTLYSYHEATSSRSLRTKHVPHSCSFGKYGTV